MNPDEMDNVTVEESTPEPTPETETEAESTPETEAEPTPEPTENESSITASISADVESIPEGNDGETATVTYTVSTSAPLDRDARVIVESTGGNNPLLSEPLDIPAGQQSVTFTNEVSGDNVAEPNETLVGTLAFAAFNAPDGSTGEEITISQSTANVTVTDDDGGGTGNVTNSEISVADVAIVEGNEGNTNLEFTVSLSEPVQEEVTVNYSTSDETAVAGEDYVTTQGSLSFAPQETSQTVSVEIVGDTSIEEDETFFLELSNALGVAIATPLDAIGTITNDDPTTPPTDTPTVSISADPTSIPEGNEGDTNTLNYIINLDTLLDRDVRVDLEFNRTGNRQSVSFNDAIVIPAGQQSITYSGGDISGDNVEEEDESTTISIQGVAYSDEAGGDIAVSDSLSSATITVVDDDGDTTDGDTTDGDTTDGDTTDGDTTDGDTTDGDTTDDGDGNDIVYRFFNPTAGVHFYTDDENERDFVEEELDNYDFEGPSYRTVDPLSGGAEDVYRFFNATTGVHLYTTNETERDSIIENLDDFTFEGSAYSAYETQVEGSIPIYRFFEPTIGVHFYTPNEAERDVVDTELDNYNNEGIAFYALPLDGDNF